MTTKEKLVELKSLMATAGRNVFQRCKLATEILADQDWIAEACDGSELKAIELIEDQYFSDLRGFITVGRLRQLYQAYSEEREWAEFRYDLGAMEAKYREDHPADINRGERKSWKQVAEALQEEVERLKMELRNREEKNRDQERAIARLEIKIEQLESQLNPDHELVSAA